MSQVQRVRVLRAFRHKGDDIGIGSVLTLDTPIAQELRGGNKVEFVTADVKGEIKPLAKKDKATPVSASRVEELAGQVSALTGQVSALAKLIEKLVAGPPTPEAKKDGK